MYDPMTRMFRALGNHRRRMVLEIIWEHARQKPGKSPRPFATITEIARRLRIAQPAVSQYVDKLVAAKLVDIKRVGPAHLCIPSDENAARLRDYFADLLRP
jgi:DNA-binding MarR family transcriptional regulator